MHSQIVNFKVITSWDELEGEVTGLDLWPLWYVAPAVNEDHFSTPAVRQLSRDRVNAPRRLGCKKNSFCAASHNISFAVLAVVIALFALVRALRIGTEPYITHLYVCGLWST